MSNFLKLRFLRPLPLLLGVMVIPSYSALAQAPLGPTEQLNTNFTTLSGGPLSLQQVALITLKNSPNILTGQLGVQSSKAYAQMASGAFDIYTSVVANTNQNRPHMYMGTDKDMQDLTFALNKQFRTGIRTSVSAGLSRADNRIGNSALDTKNFSHLNLNITIPLLKGRGYVSAAAAETSARLKSQAAELNFYHNISNLLLNSINAYWDYKAAIENLQVQKSSEKRIQDWIDVSVEGLKLKYGSAETFFKRHEAQHSRIKGYLASKHRNTFAAIERVNTSKAALAVIMGLPHEQVINIGEPSEEFTHDWSDTLPKVENRTMLDKWIVQAKEKRLDIHAAKLNQDASAVQLAKARQDMLPQLNLGLNVGRNAIELGDGYNHYIGAFDSDIRGTNAGVMLQFAYPLGNNIAKGQRDLANASHKLNMIKMNDLIRKISVQINVDAGVLKRRMKEAVSAFKAVSFYGSAVEKSYEEARDTLLHHPNNLLHMLDLDEKLTEASDHLTTSTQELAKAIAKLSFQTGTILLRGSMNPDELELGELSKIPGL